MQAILAITSPIYLIMLLGFLFTRSGAFGKADIRVLGKFATHLALPALVFKALSERRFGEIFNASYLLAYLLGSLAVIVCGYLWSRRVARLEPTASALRVMGMACPNSAFVGYPIVLLTVAPVAGVALALNMLVENLVLIPLVLLLAERGRGGARQRPVLRQAFVRVAKMPIMIGLFAGLAVSMLRWPMPAAVTQTVNLVAAASGAISLFVIGGTLVSLPVRGLGKEILPVVVGKLFVQPLFVLLAIMAMPLLGMPEIEPALRIAAVILCAVPMLSIYVTLAQAYGEEDFSAAAQLVTTVASFFTLSGLLWLLAHFPL